MAASLLLCSRMRTSLVVFSRSEAPCRANALTVMQSYRTMPSLQQGNTNTMEKAKEVVGEAKDKMKDTISGVAEKANEIGQRATSTADEFYRQAKQQGRAALDNTSSSSSSSSSSSDDDDDDNPPQGQAQ